MTAEAAAAASAGGEAAATAVRVLVAAFASDPFLSWLLPRGPRPLFEPVVAEAAATGNLDVESGLAAAVWQSVPAEPAEPAKDETFPSGLPERLAAYLQAAEARHPRGQAHLYLRFIGVDPAAAGRGLGSALIRRRLARADAAELPTYLEASAPRNLRLYERHGFVRVGGPISVLDSPPVWPMWREPLRRPDRASAT